MTFKTGIKFLSVSAAMISLAACSSGYDDRYDDSGYYGVSSDYYSGGYGAQFGNAGYGMAGAAGYGMAGYGMGGNCMPNAQYGAQYAGGYTQGGLRSGGGRYGSDIVATGNVEFYGEKSRYGTWQQSSGSQNCNTGGYWTVPTYQLIQQPPAPAPAPVITTTPAVTIQEPCGDGQYRMDNGDCAIMITDEPEQYVPPVTGYQPVETPNLDWYQPIRK